MDALVRRDEATSKVARSAKQSVSEYHVREHVGIYGVMFNQLLDLLFPPRCVGCGSLEGYICKKCQKLLSYRAQLCPMCDRAAIDGLTHPYCKKPYGLDGVISVYPYAGVIKAAIKQLKYRFVSDIASTLVAGISKSTVAFLPKNILIYPIPLHKERMRWRGFDQAQKLVEHIAPQLNLQTVDGLLTRSKKKTPQADISEREKRILNVRDIFVLASKKPPKYILLIDDVYTTGATMKEAAKILKGGGAKEVFGLTIAR